MSVIAHFIVEAWSYEWERAPAMSERDTPILTHIVGEHFGYTLRMYLYLILILIVFQFVFLSFGNL